MRDSKKLVGHLYAMFTILVWGSCFVLTKNLLAVGITAVQIIPLRMILAYVTLLVMRPRFMRLPLRDELMFILIGITGGSVYFFLQNSAPRAYLRRERQYPHRAQPHPDGHPRAALLAQGRAARQVGLHRRGDRDRGRGDGCPQRYAHLPPQPRGRPAGAGRGAAVGDLFHPDQALHGTI